MFKTELTDSFIVYNHKKQCSEEKHLDPEFDILGYGEKIKKISRRKQWYPDCNLQLNDISLCSTKRGKYLRFDLFDYGVRDIWAVFYKLLLDSKPIDDTEYCRSVWYDSHDSISLYAPISEEIPVESIVLCITGIKYRANCESIEKFSSPQKITVAEKNVIHNIRSARAEHIAIPKSLANATRISSTCKFPFDEDYLPTAWQLYPELAQSLSYANVQCDLLERAIAALPQTISEIDCTPPTLDDAKVYIPIECTFNPKFYARLFMVKRHIVEGQVISVLDMLQLQIPIKADNEPLLLFLYGTHWLAPLIMPSNQMIGTDKCADIWAEAKGYSAILGLVDEIRNRTSYQYKEQLVLSSNVFKRYLKCVQTLRAWIKERYAEVSAYSKAERPSTWTNEYKLFRYIKLLIPDAVYQYRANWLGFQSLDIFLPSCNCAIEYQGRQHYDSIEYFGGDTGLMERQKNDADKIQKCKDNGVKLIEWPYSEKVFFSKVCAFLNENVQPGLVDDSYIRKCLISSVPFPVMELFTPATYSQTKALETPKEISPVFEIRKYGMDGLYICSYATVADAAEDVHITGQQISKALSGRAVTAGGFLWKRTAAEAPADSVQVFQPKEPENSPKSIYQISEMGEIVGEYDSINAAEKATGINRKSIRDVLYGRQKRAGGFYWKGKSNT